MKKNKTNALKIALFVFLGITIVGITASLFRGLRNEDKTSGESTNVHKHDYEVISSVASTCTVPGTETLKCKTCDDVKTVALPLAPHVDEDGNCSCDMCAAPMHSYTGNICENCYEYIPHDCYDGDGDSKCEICGTILEHECEENDDHNCSICGSHIHTFSEYGECFYCDFVISHTCDENEDMLCDLCGGDLNDYLLGNETDHRDEDDNGECDYCTGSFCDGEG